MKIPPLSMTWPSVAAASLLLCLGTFQACQTTRLARTSPIVNWPDPVEILPNDAKKSDKEKKNLFKTALNKHHGRVDSRTRFCVRRGANGRDCETIYQRSVAAVVGSIKTEQIIQFEQLEAGGGDEDRVEAIHVAQQISFDSAQAAENFLKDLGLPPDSGQ